MGPRFAQSLELPSLKALVLGFSPYSNIFPTSIHSADPPPSYGEGVLTLLRKFGGQLNALLLNYDVLNSSSFPACPDLLDNDRLRTLSFITISQARPAVNVPLHTANQY